MYRNKWFLFILKFLLSAALIWLVARNVEFEEALARIGDVTSWSIGIFMLLALLLNANNGYRWALVLAAIGERLPFATAFKFNWIGFFFSQTLPSTFGGDAARMFLAYKHGVDVKTAVNSVMLERVTTLSGLILLVLLTQPFFLARMGDGRVEFVFPALAVAAILGVILLMYLDRIPERFRNLRIVEWLAKLANDTRLLFAAPLYAISAIVMGATGTAIIAIAVYLTGRTLGIEFTLLDCLVLVPPVILIAAITISIAGWGVREGAMVFAFGLIGVPNSDALVLSILIGLLFMLFSFGGGVIFIAGGYRRRDIAEKFSDEG